MRIAMIGLRGIPAPTAGSSARSRSSPRSSSSAGTSHGVRPQRLFRHRRARAPRRARRAPPRSTPSTSRPRATARSPWRTRWPAAASTSFTCTPPAPARSARSRGSPARRRWSPSRGSTGAGRSGGRGPLGPAARRRCSARFPNRTIVVSLELKRYFAEHHGADAVYIPNGVHEEAAEARPPRPIWSPTLRALPRPPRGRRWGCRRRRSVVLGEVALELTRDDDGAVGKRAEQAAASCRNERPPAPLLPAPVEPWTVTTVACRPSRASGLSAPGRWRAGE